MSFRTVEELAEATNAMPVLEDEEAAFTEAFEPEPSPPPEPEDVGEIGPMFDELQQMEDERRSGP